MAQSEFFINAVELIDLEGATNIPTVLCYEKGSREPLIGSAARSKARQREELNEDFKVDLGNLRPGTTGAEQFTCADGRRRSAGELTADFLTSVVRTTSKWLEARNLKTDVNVLVAEPLSMLDGLVSDNWLANYRNNVRRILTGKGFEKIDFLPEPFAVYQFYRHGAKHPILAEQRKHYALVIDFGGGTFDVCLIETTKTGDVAVGNRMAKPLAASSKAIGGYSVNKAIAEHLARKLATTGEAQTRITKALKEYARWRRDGTDVISLSLDYQHFIKNFSRLSYRIEDAKLALSRTIRQWKLEGLDPGAVPIAVPDDFFAASPAFVTLLFSAQDFRTLFIEKLWNPELKNVVKLALDRGRQESNGANISVVLLSGGSANIRWLAELLRRDFATDLSYAELLSIPDFQEVVSKGLAIECARRYYTPDATGDFAATTYNRLCLVLEADKTGCDLKRFTPRDSELPAPDIPGVLLPSATALTKFRDRPMRWKVRLDASPKHDLHYYFLKSSFDPDDHQNLQNVEESCVHTPKDARFDANITVELRVSEDGTSTPKFIYYSGHSDGDSISSVGRPFFLDMTSTESTGVAKAFVGLDFGTSNSSLSYVSQDRVEVYERRGLESSWSELSDLASTLPYPLAAPLAHYIRQADPTQLATASRQFIESALTIAAYVTFLDIRSSGKRKQTNFFKVLRKRSVGPIWGLLKQLLQHPSDQTSFSSAYQKLRDPVFFQEMDEVVDRINSQKHDKIEDEAVRALRPVQILANISHELFSNNIFGMFSQVHKRRFGSVYEGTFRHAHGRPPFIEASHYQGTIAFSDYETFLVDRQDGRSLQLEPLILWHQCPKHPELEDGHCFLFDSCEDDGSFTYIAVGFRCTFHVFADNESTADLHGQLMQWKVTDPSNAVFKVNLTEAEPGY